MFSTAPPSIYFEHVYPFLCDLKPNSSMMTLKMSLRDKRECICWYLLHESWQYPAGTLFHAFFECCPCFPAITEEDLLSGMKCGPQHLTDHYINKHDSCLPLKRLNVRRGHILLLRPFAAQYGHCRHITHICTDRNSPRSQLSTSIHSKIIKNSR